MANITAKAEVDVAASSSEVWNALTDPQIIARYFFGSRVETDWRPGSPIRWEGEYQGKKYEDRGEVLEVERDRLLKVTHFSPMSGLPDKPENYHTLVFELEPRGDTTHVSLTQDHNNDEAEAEHATENWRTVLEGLKKTVEEH